MNRPARRYQSVDSKFVHVPFRDTNGAFEIGDICREDHLDPDPDGDLVYLVLDFLDEERLLPGGDYVPTGKLVLELQAVHRDTGEGFALPHQRHFDPNIPERPKPIEQLGVIVAHEYSTKPITGLTLITDSPRRAQGN